VYADARAWQGVYPTRPEIPIRIEAVMAAVIALALYGWHTALAGRPLFGAGFLEDEPTRRG
jgi:hypothetical protein